MTKLKGQNTYLIFLISFLPIAVYCEQLVTRSNYEINDLVSNTSYFQTQLGHWLKNSAYSPPYFQCQQINMLGTNDITIQTAKYTRLYTGLKSHSYISVLLTFWIFGNWTGNEKITVTLGASLSSLSFTSYFKEADGKQTIQCGSQQKKYTIVTDVLIGTAHTDSTISITVQSTFPTSGNQAWFGVRDIDILLSTNNRGSATCILSNLPAIFNPSDLCNCPWNTYSLSGTCVASNLACKLNFLDGTSQNCAICQDGYSNTATGCVACDDTCNTCFGSSYSNCLTCTSGRYLYNNSICLTSCPTPLITTQDNGVDVCQPPCMNYGSDYYYDLNTNSCVTTCPSSSTAYQQTSSLKDVVNLCTKEQTTTTTTNTSTTTNSTTTASADISNTNTSTTTNSTATNTANTTNSNTSTMTTTMTEIMVTAINVADKAQKVATAGATAVLLTMPNDSGNMMLVSLAKLFACIRYINASYTPSLIESLYRGQPTAVPFTDALDMTSAMKGRFSKRIVPPKFASNDIVSCFIINFWDQMVLISLVCGFTFAVYAIESLAKRNKNKYKVVSIFHKVRIPLQNLL